MADIKNIIFDFGGVIINISHQKVENAFKSLGVKNFEALFNKATQSDLFQQFEKGEISASQFRSRIRTLTGLNVSDDKLDGVWNQIIGDYPLKRIDLLNQIKLNYRLFLLSNTNIIHYNYYIPKFHKEFGFSFQSIFEKAYWSFKLRERKPDLISYKHVLRESNLKPAETLFIDDSIQNILAAQELGIHAVHLTEEIDVTEIFTNGRFNQTFLFK